MEELKKAVETIRKHGFPAGTEYYNAMLIVLDLAERVLAVGAKMPEKMTIFRSGDEEILFTHNDIRRRINETIYQCTIAITGALLNKNELRHEITKEYYASDERATLLAEQIHSAQIEKLGGVR